MCPDRSTLLRAQRGFALMSAIFLMVVLAVLGAGMLTFSSTQHAGSAMDIQGARAYQAARAGIEWGAYRALVDGSCVAGPTTVALAGDLSAFTLQVSCSQTTSGSLNAYDITANAHTSAAVGSLGYVERELRATVAE